MRHQKLHTKRRSDKIWKILLGLFVLIGSLLIIYIVLISHLFTVKVLDIRLDKVNCISTDEIRNKSLILGQKIFFPDFTKALALPKQYPCIKSVSLSKILPDKVVMAISGREAVAKIKVLKEATSSGSINVDPAFASQSAVLASQSATIDFSKLQPVESFVIDGDGVIFDVDKGQSLPFMYVYGNNLKIGQRLDNVEVANAVSILAQLKTLGFVVTSVQIDNGDLVTESSPQLRCSLEDNINNQLGSVQLILEEAKMENRDIELVDLRFSNPVVKYSNQTKSK